MIFILKSVQSAGAAKKGGDLWHHFDISCTLLFLYVIFLFNNLFDIRRNVFYYLCMFDSVWKNFLVQRIFVRRKCIVCMLYDLRIRGTPEKVFDRMSQEVVSWVLRSLDAKPSVFHSNFLFLEELSNITYSSSLTLTVVQNLARLNQLNVSHFVIQRQLLLLRRPETPCRPSKCVPSERLRLAEVINFP